MRFKGKGEKYVLHTENTKEENKIKYINFFSSLIEALGYDPQCACLVVKLSRNGQVRIYEGVPEDIWYRLRENNNPDMYYRKHICGCFPERTNAL